MRSLMAAVMLACTLVVPERGESQTLVPVDGVYDGTASLVGTTARRCEALYTFKLYVKNRAFTWSLPNQIKVQVPVGADGTFAAENGQRFLNGKIAGNRLAATTTGRGCGYIWSFTRE